MTVRGRLTPQFSGPTLSCDARRERIMKWRARAAHVLGHHGPLQLLVRRLAQALLTLRVFVNEMQVRFAKWRNAIKHPVDRFFKGLPRRERDSSNVNRMRCDAVLVRRAIAVFTKPHAEASVSERRWLRRAIGDLSHAEQSLLPCRERPGLQLNP